LCGLDYVEHRDEEKDLLKLPQKLARAHDLSSYDASYLDLAMKKGLPLATLDQKLRAAAQSVKVPILPE
jgi:predicted nucleic acid-binding protein